MSRKEQFERVKKSTTLTLSKITNKIEMASKISKLKLQNSNFSSEIYSIKAKIGDFVFNNKAEFSKNKKLKEYIKRLEHCTSQININLKEIDGLK